jgi:hypothetical protein
VLAERVAVRAGYFRDRPLERLIVEGVDLPACPAYEVMVMLAAGLGGFETGEALTEVDAVDETQLGELVERSVHARNSDGAVLGPEPVEDVLGRDAAALLGQVCDHGLAGGA